MSGERLSQLSRSIAGRVAIVTGAASGMGRATAHLFADEGAHVAVVDLGAGRVQTVVDEIAAVHGPDRAAGFVVDVASPAAVERLIADTTARWGRIDILINNAGVSLAAGAYSPTDEFEAAWAQTLDVNLTAHARLIRAALAELLRSDAGRVVNIASTETLVVTAGLAAYAATKAAVVGLTKSFAVELGRTEVTVNCVCPGPIHTGMTAVIPDEAKQLYARRRVAKRRYGTPEEVAQMTLSLVLPAASFTTGAVLVVDGGLTIKH